MANFDYAFEKTIKHEGGYNDVKGDAGGATNWGISLRFLKDLHKTCSWVDIDGDGDVDATDIKNLKIEDAKKIYFNQFWSKQKCDLIKDDVVAAKVFDMSVNMGLIQSGKLLQRACQLCGKNITDDGIIGSGTINAVDSIKPEELITAIRYQCVQFYLNLVEKNKDYNKFLKGWLRRAVS